MGYSRDSFYHFKDLYEIGGKAALADISRKKSLIKNRVPDHIKQSVIELAIENPALSQLRTIQALPQKGIIVLLAVYVLYGLEMILKP